MNGCYFPFNSESVILYFFFNQEMDYLDPYEAAVIALPVLVKERLVRILRLGIATRYDVS